MSFVKEVLAEGILVMTGAGLMRATGNDHRELRSIARARTRACMLAGGFFWLGALAGIFVLCFR